jgi:hypothetical protein
VILKVPIALQLVHLLLADLICATLVTLSLSRRFPKSLSTSPIHKEYVVVHSAANS